MSNFQPELLNWQTGLLAGWTYQREVKTWYQGSFRTQHELTRLCPTCGATIKCRVTRRALEGDAINHGLALRRCEPCRDALKGRSEESYENRKANGKADAALAVQADALQTRIVQLESELASLRQHVVNTDKELIDAYARIDELEGGSVQQKPVTMEKMPWE